MHLLKKKNGVFQPYSLTQSFKHLLSEAYIYTPEENLVSTRQTEVLDCGRIKHMREVRAHVRREEPYPECLPQPLLKSVNQHYQE